MTFTACDVLDVDPMHSMPADQAITNAQGVQRGIIGSYDAMQGVGYYGRNYVVIGDLAADNLIWSGTTAGYDQINSNNILADNVIVEGIWASIYSSLNRVNNVIVQIPGVGDMTQGQKDQALAELYFLRALHHYNLMRLFGPVPIRTQPATAEEASLNLPRSSVADVLQQVETDLAFATEHLPDNIIRGRATRPAAQALKARVSLHKYFINNNNAFLDEAVNYASAVIAHPNLQLESDFATLFMGGNNSESIFEIEFNEQDRNRYAEYFFHTSMSGRYEFSPPAEFIANFTDNDLRKDASIQMAGTNPYGNKYNDIETGTDNVYVFRLAEMHLIRAEALALLSPATHLDQIHDDINAVRERAGLVPTTVSNPNAILLEIEIQRQKEFAFEGHRWFDLVRTNRAIILLENVTHTDQTLFPIPLTELLANDNPGMGQNPGY